VAPRSAAPPSPAIGPDVPPTRLNRPGGDVEVVRHDGRSGTRLRGTWRRLGLRALWAAPLLAIEGAVLGGIWWVATPLRPAVLVVAGLLLVRHLVRGLREVRGVVSGWLEVDAAGLRGPALGADLAWDPVQEVRLAGDADRPVVAYLTEEGAATLEPDVLPTESLLDVLVPVGKPLAFGHPGDDPRDLRVEAEGFHLLPPRGRPLSVRWDAVVSVESRTVTCGDRRSRSLDLLVELRAPGTGPSREELVSVPITLARSSGLLDALRRFDASLPERLEAAPAGTHELWSA
jgi:hypothetical protein